MKNLNKFEFCFQIFFGLLRDFFDDYYSDAASERGSFVPATHFIIILYDNNKIEVVRSFIRLVRVSYGIAASIMRIELIAANKRSTKKLPFCNED